MISSPFVERLAREMDAACAWRTVRHSIKRSAPLMVERLTILVFCKEISVTIKAVSTTITLGLVKVTIIVLGSLYFIRKLSAAEHRGSVMGNLNPEHMIY